MNDETRQRDQAKQERLAAALRENLKRRKAQAKEKAKARATVPSSAGDRATEADPQTSPFLSDEG